MKNFGKWEREIFIKRPHEGEQALIVSDQTTLEDPFC